MDRQNASCDALLFVFGFQCLVSVSGKITLDGRLDLKETASEAADASVHILCLSMNHTLMDETAIISTHVCSHPLQSEK